jgi:hypothetical protein
VLFESDRRVDARAQGTTGAQAPQPGSGRLPGRTRPATVSRVERGLVEPSPRTVVSLARALGTSVAKMRDVLAESLEEAVTSEHRP